MYEKEVSKGAAWLDQVEPGWHKRVNIKELDLSICKDCCLGQILGVNASYALNGDDDFAIQRGFNIQNKLFQDDKKHYRLLNSAWIQEILRRRNADRMVKESIQKVKESK